MTHIIYERNCEGQANSYRVDLGEELDIVFSHPQEAHSGKGEGHARA
jgi:hypothetical protein